MLFLIPAGILALKAAAATVATVTAAKVATTVIVCGSAALGAKALHDAGRRKGKTEGKETHAAEIRAMRERLDEMEKEA